MTLLPPRGHLAHSLLWPLPFGGALLLALGAAVLTGVILWPRTRLAGWRVDESHKVSETYALRLLLERRWNDPAWTANIVDRSNPPFGKYAFGLGVLAAGEELPATPSLSRLARHGVMAPHADAASARPYLPLLTPCRRVSLFATALTLGLVTFMAARLHSVLAAVIAFAWSARHWMTAAFGGDAIFDPLLACLVFVSLPLVLVPRRTLLVAPILGLVCAMAFQTRLNGGIAVAAVGAVLLLQKNWKALLVVGVTFAVAAVAMNPFYWPNPITRFAQQISDLRTILDALTADGVRLPLWAAESSARTPVAWTAFQKLRFTGIALGGSIAGTALFVGVIAGCWAATRARSFALLLWCAVVIAGTLLWLPLPWARYLLVILPPVTLLAGIGYGAGLRGVFEAWR